MAFTPKPPKGSAFMERKGRRAQRIQVEHSEMQAAKKRDGFRCRWPGCNGKFKGLDLPIDACHGIAHRGPGGNPDGSRTKQAVIISLCREHHRQLDGHEIEIHPLTSAVFDGPVSFHVRCEESGVMQHVASETSIGVSVAVGA